MVPPRLHPKAPRMSLTDILYEALDSVPGARFAGVVGTDGLSIEMVYADGDDTYDLGLAELELATIAATVSAASGRIGSGHVLDLTIETEDLTFMASLIIPGYFAVLALPSDGDIGDARYTMRELLVRVEDEL
jgi:predicted regulator of Ras-like GTPase activity (Roadblock/LC7/MglB family)